MYANQYPLLLIKFLILSYPGHSYFNLPHLPRPTHINYWGKFPTETNFLKQYTCAEFFAIFQNE